MAYCYVYQFSLCANGETGFSSITSRSILECVPQLDGVKNAIEKICTSIYTTAIITKYHR